MTGAVRFKITVYLLLMAAFYGAWINASAQTYSLLISDKVISNFFEDLSAGLPHEIIKLNRDILEWNERDLYGEQDSLFQIDELTEGLMQIDSVKLFFTPKDLKYVEKQFQNLEGHTWYAEDFRKFEVIDSMGLKRILAHSYSGKKIGKYYTYTFSVPFFSLNGEYAIVQQEFYCGIECSTYCIYLYRRSVDKRAWEKAARWKCISATTVRE